MLQGPRKGRKAPTGAHRRDLLSISIWIYSRSIVIINHCTCLRSIIPLTWTHPVQDYEPPLKNQCIVTDDPISYDYLSLGNSYNVVLFEDCDRSWFTSTRLIITTAWTSSVSACHAGWFPPGLCSSGQTGRTFRRSSISSKIRGFFMWRIWCGFSPMTRMRCSWKRWEFLGRLMVERSSAASPQQENTFDLTSRSEKV